MTSQEIRTMSPAASGQANNTTWINWSWLSLNLRKLLDLRSQTTNAEINQNHQAQTTRQTNNFFPSAEEGQVARQELDRMLLRRI